MSNLLKLENQVCFPLYAFSREVTQLYKPLLDELGLTYPQYLVMLILWEEKEQTVNQIGEKLYLDSGTLTPLLKRMEQKGIINRKRVQKTVENFVVKSLLSGNFGRCFYWSWAVRPGEPPHAVLI